MNVVQRNRGNKPHNYFRVSQADMSCPKCDIDHVQDEKYLWFEPRFLSRNIRSDQMEISHTADTEMSLLRRKPPSIINQLFKQRSSSIELRSKERLENFDVQEFGSNETLTEKLSSQAGHKTFSVIDTKQSIPNSSLYLTEVSSSTGAELMTISVSKYSKWEKMLKPQKSCARTTRSYRSLERF